MALRILSGVTRLVVRLGPRSSAQAVTVPLEAARAGIDPYRLLDVIELENAGAMDGLTIER